MKVDGGDPAHAHGTRQRYQSGCRCSPCTLSNTVYEREWRAAHTPRYVQLELPNTVHR